MAATGKATYIPRHICSEANELLTAEHFLRLLLALLLSLLLALLLYTEVNELLTAEHDFRAQHVGHT